VCEAEICLRLIIKIAKQLNHLSLLLSCHITRPLRQISINSAFINNFPLAKSRHKDKLQEWPIRQHSGLPITLQGYDEENIWEQVSDVVVMHARR